MRVHPRVEDSPRSCFRRRGGPCTGCRCGRCYRAWCCSRPCRTPTSIQVVPPSSEISITPPSMSTLRRVQKRNDQRCLNERPNVVPSIVNGRRSEGLIALLRNIHHAPPAVRTLEGTSPQGCERVGLRQLTAFETSDAYRRCRWRAPDFVRRSARRDRLVRGALAGIEGSVTSASSSISLAGSPFFMRTFALTVATSKGAEWGKLRLDTVGEDELDLLRRDLRDGRPIAPTPALRDLQGDASGLAIVEDAVVIAARRRRR